MKEMNNYELMLEEFKSDTEEVALQTEKLLNLVYPSYLISDNIENLIDTNSTDSLNNMIFFRIGRCVSEDAENILEEINFRFEKLVSALHAASLPIAFGIISRDGVTNIILGVNNIQDASETVETITKGMLSGIELEGFNLDLKNQQKKKRHYGFMAGIPALFVDEQKQNFSLASIMRSLNGQNYSLMFVARPVDYTSILEKISQLIVIKDSAFAVSKRNIARSQSYSETKTDTKNENDGNGNVAGQVGSGAGAAIGAIIGTIIAPGLGTMVGTTIGGGLGTVIGNVVGGGKSHSEGFSASVSKTINDSKTISGDVQNSFALELMGYADNAIERLKAGQNIGMWQTAITYSAENEISRNIIKACLIGELSKLDSKKLPMRSFEMSVDDSEDLLKIPKFSDNSNENEQNRLCSLLNSAELGLMCSVPTESVPDFELRIERKMPLVIDREPDNKIIIGFVADGKRAMKNMPFGLSEKDLNKHTFVCGMTGSGKTTTVKKILIEAKKPFLVIESAKKEYRNLAIRSKVYTFGKPEINAPQVNPFYIIPGISPQMHIDYLKDLFNAAFSFYGPMQYILEKCLHSIYRKKGWNLTLGFHPLLVNYKSPSDFFDINNTKEQYKKIAHQHLFPTMQDLKEEVIRYIDQDLKYDGEVAGNIKTAMKVRLENLCVGSKGYSFNTNDFIDFEQLLKENSVFELEGLSDDSDKAFGVGLLLIFINEYRQVEKECAGNEDVQLMHLLVIEEAHRLLKNVDTERSTETTGNPKGKAVEHFTNMLAEMRSYGQGVIVAEQIPSKLAPDVIKNSSTKLVQRLVSVDDQELMATAIGIKPENALQLGTLSSGYAYCHKEGMSLPSPVKISNTYIKNENGTSVEVEEDLDTYVSDETLYNNGINDRFERINLSIIRNSLGDDVSIKELILGYINTLMIEEDDICINASNTVLNEILNIVKNRNLDLSFVKNGKERLLATYATELIIVRLVRGVYCVKTLPDNEFVATMKKMLYSPDKEGAKVIKNWFGKLYDTNDIRKFALHTVSALVKRSRKNNMDIQGTIRTYFTSVSEKNISEIISNVKGGD